MICFANNRSQWQSRSAMERALLACSTFAHMSAEEISEHLDAVSDTTPTVRAWTGLKPVDALTVGYEKTTPDKQVYSARVINWMATLNGATCFLCQTVFEVQQSNNMRRFLQLTNGNFLPCADSAETPLRFIPAQPICTDCASIVKSSSFQIKQARGEPIWKAWDQMDEDGAAFALTSVISNNRFRKRVRDNAHRRFRVKPNQPVSDTIRIYEAAA